MSYELDAELAPAMAALAARAAEAQAPARGDWQAVRTAAAAGLAYESIAYASGLAKAGVPVELHVHPGAPHGFERFVPDAGVAQRAMADRTALSPPSSREPHDEAYFEWPAHPSRSPPPSPLPVPVSVLGGTRGTEVRTRWHTDRFQWHHRGPMTGTRHITGTVRTT